MQAILVGYLYLLLTEIIYIFLHIRDSREIYVYKNNYWCLEEPAEVLEFSYNIYTYI